MSFCVVAAAFCLERLVQLAGMPGVWTPSPAACVPVAPRASSGQVPLRRLPSLMADGAEEQVAARPPLLLLLSQSGTSVSRLCDSTDFRFLVGQIWLFLVSLLATQVYHRQEGDEGSAPVSCNILIYEMG